ncbi:MAG: ABC transporter permease [Alphaproteobacteria bacterium]
MGRFMLLRLRHGLIVVLGVTVVVFIVTRMIGDPVRLMLPLEATPEQRAAFEHQLGFDRSIPVQFVDFVSDLVVLDFGDSLWQRRPAMDIVVEALPMTLYLVGAGLGLAIVLAIPLGVLAALRPGSMLDRVTVFLSLLGLSIPQFWLGLLLAVIFAVNLGWLDHAGAFRADSIILPAVTLALPAMTRLVMVVRSQMIDELNAQYVKTAQAKGMPFLRVIGVHAMRNAAVPVLTLAAWEFIRALAGYTVIVETVFAWPGLGLAAMQAIERQDLILLQAIVFTVAIMVVVINLAVDAAYKAIDPRIKLD